MTDSTPFAAWLRAELDARGWSNVELARRAAAAGAPVSRQAVDNWLAGRRVPKPAGVAALAAALGLPPAEVLARVGAGDPPGAPAPGDPRRARIAALAHRLPDDLLDPAVAVLEGLAALGRRRRPE